MSSEYWKKPIFLLPYYREREWWRRRRPEWRVFWFEDTAAGHRSDRVVIQMPQFFLDDRDRWAYMRAFDRARTMLNFPGRLLIVDWRGAPISCYRHY